MQNIPTLVITLTVIYLLFEALRALRPVDISAFQTDKPVEELRKKYLKYDFITLGLLFLLSIPLTFIYYFIFAGVSDFRLSLLKETVIVVKPFPATWFLSAMFTAMLTATLIIPVLLKWRLKADWGQYCAYGYVKAGYSPKSASITSRIFAVITAILVIGSLDWFTAFRQGDIIVNRFFGLGAKTYQYADIIDIRDVKKLEAPNGNIVEDEHYIIVFNDGSKWNSRKSGFGDYGKDAQVIDLIAQKTGKQVTNLEFDTD